MTVFCKQRDIKKSLYASQSPMCLQTSEQKDGLDLPFMHDILLNDVIKGQQ